MGSRLAQAVNAFTPNMRLSSPPSTTKKKKKKKAKKKKEANITAELCKGPSTLSAL
jgi:hypothetical protein